jgi:predicted phage-related endonuclease
MCPTHGKCVFEAKTACAFKLGEWDDTIPDEYMLQVQHYIAVTDSNGAYIAVLIGGNTFKWRFIARDDELISMLIQEESATSEFMLCRGNRSPAARLRSAFRGCRVTSLRKNLSV